mgnify:CR=1 FL=1
MIYTFKEILDKHGILIHELRRNLPTDEKERDAYVLGIITVLYEMFEKNEASKIVDAVIQDELIDYVL